MYCVLATLLILSIRQQRQRWRWSSPPGVAAVMFSCRSYVCVWTLVILCMFIRSRVRVCVYFHSYVCVCVYTVSLMSLPLFIVNKIIGFPRPWKRTKYKKDCNNTNRLILAVRVPFGLLCTYSTVLHRSFEHCTHKS